MKIKIYGLIIFSVIVLCACTINSRNTEDYVSMKDALKISVFTYDEETDINSFETLELNEPKTLMRMGTIYNGIEMTNFNFHFSYAGGICHILSEEKDIQLSVGPNGGIWEHGQPTEIRTFGYEMTVSDAGYIAVNPYGSGHGTIVIENEDRALHDSVETYTGREYWLTVNACNFDDIPIIRAKLKIVQLEERESPVIKGRMTDGFYSIELVSYEYSDAYKIMEGAMG